MDLTIFMILSQELAEEFKKQFTCLGHKKLKNTLPLQFPQKRKLQELMKRRNYKKDILYITVY